MRSLLFFLLLIFSVVRPAPAQKATSWRAAKPAELEAALPARAPVERERIETEMRTATGIVNEHGQMVAAVVLITAGYAADGKYSHFLLLQSPFTIGDQTLAPGPYVVGWKRAEEGLFVRFYDAATGTQKVEVLAKPLANTKRVESFRIWPPAERSIIQIGRYMLPYSVGD